MLARMPSFMTTPQRILIAALLVAAAAAQAQTAPTPASSPANSQPAAEQVIVPEVQRRDIKRPRYPSRDFAIGLYGGVYSAENFGSNGVAGVRLSYHITEDFFVDATYGETKITDEAFRQILPGGIFAEREQKLTYYGVSIAYNLLPGEVFFGRNYAKATQGYILGGIGSTDFAGQRRQTYHAGFGLRLILSNRFAVQADVRNYIYTLDILGQRKSTNNPEVTAGLTLFF
jgi:outer membrane beta-barrel protein